MACKSGLGLAVLPTFIVQRQLDEGSLQVIEPGVRPTDNWIHALYPRSRRASPKVLALCDFLQQRLANPPWQQRL